MAYVIDAEDRKVLICWSNMSGWIIFRDKGRMEMCGNRELVLRTKRDRIFHLKADGWIVPSMRSCEKFSSNVMFLELLGVMGRAGYVCYANGDKASHRDSHERVPYNWRMRVAPRLVSHVPTNYQGDKIAGGPLSVVLETARDSLWDDNFWRKGVPANAWVDDWNWMKWLSWYYDWLPKRIAEEEAQRIELARKRDQLSKAHDELFRRKRRASGGAKRGSLTRIR